LPNLRGATPAQWLVARGHRGLRELTYGLVDWMPRLDTPQNAREAIEALALREAMQPSAVGAT
jgi:hypothetical protein